jgi:WD40 repeat protein
MRTALAGRLARALASRMSRALVGCYPRRWKQRYAAELLDVLDQHRAGPRTVLSLAGGALSTHLDPDYRMKVRLLPRLSRDAVLLMAIFAAVSVGLFAILVIGQIPRNIRESHWHPSSGDSVGLVAFSRDQRIMVSATGTAPWEATSTLWGITGQGRPRRLAVFEGGNPVAISPDGTTVAAPGFGGKTLLWDVARPRHPARLAALAAGSAGEPWGEAFSPDGRILAIASTGGLALWNVADPARPRLLRTLAASLQTGNPGNFDVGDSDLVFAPDGQTLASASGRDQVTLWDVARPARAARIATLAGPGDYFTALAFAPHGNLLAGVTYHGTVAVFRLARPGRPVRVSTRRGSLDRARFHDGAGGPGRPCGPGCTLNAAYALAFAPGGHALTVVIDRPEPWPSPADRDTIFTWPVAGSGALGDVSTTFRNVNDAQPTLAPGGRLVADGAIAGGRVRLWTLP